LEQRDSLVRPVVSADNGCTAVRFNRIGCFTQVDWVGARCEANAYIQDINLSVADVVLTNDLVYLNDIADFGGCFFTGLLGLCLENAGCVDKDTCGDYRAGITAMNMISAPILS